jgi:AraC family transcriptional regulator
MTDIASPVARLRVERELTAAGLIQLAPAAEHRIKVHASGPTRGACGASAFVYTWGDVDILPAGNSDGWLQHEASTSLMLSVSASLVAHVAMDLGLDAARVTLEPQNHLRDARIEHIAWALDGERVEAHPAGLLYADSLGTALVVHLLGRYRSVDAPGPGGLSRRQLTRVLEYIDAHLDRDLALQRLASVAGLSMTHFKVLFRRSTGLPVHAYVVQQRVARARALLARGDRPIAQVALESGFAHQSHLARSMRKLLGVAPSDLLPRGARLD